MIKEISKETVGKTVLENQKGAYPSTTEMLKTFNKAIRELGNVYNAKPYLFALTYQVSQMEFYNRNCLEKDYEIKVKPTTGDIAYFQLTVGFPKELAGGHWCYIVKDFSSKALIIPLCSIKASALNSGEPLNNSDFNLYVNAEFGDHIKTISKMSFSDMRVVDYQRLDTRRAFGKLDGMTHQDVLNKMNELIGGGNK